MKAECSPQSLYSSCHKLERTDFGFGSSIEFLAGQLEGIFPHLQIEQIWSVYQNNILQCHWVAHFTAELTE